MGSEKRTGRGGGGGSQPPRRPRGLKRLKGATRPRGKSRRAAPLAGAAVAAARPRKTTAALEKPRTGSPAAPPKGATPPSDLALLSSWAMQLPSSGLVLVRGREIAVANLAFDRLSDSMEGPLVREPLTLAAESRGAQTPRSFATLRHVAREGAALVTADGGAGTSAVQRYRSVSQERWIDVLFDRAPGPDRLAVGVFHDVTAQVKAEAELAVAQNVLARQEHMRAIGELTAGIVHDVSNTLGAIRLRLSALSRDAVCMAAQGANIKALERIVSEGTDMLQKLQRLGDSDENQPPEAVELSQSVAGAIEVAQSGLRYRAVHDGVDIRIENAVPPLPEVIAWRNDLQRVFVNLLINARDAMPLGGRIRVSGERVGEQLVVKVEDEGTGIEPGVMPRIFEPYFTTKGSTGTGMGLSTVQRAMARIGGSVAASNRSRGGALFTLCFPLRRAAAEAPTHVPASGHLLNPPD
jgi:signal transduction histidine kinase